MKSKDDKNLLEAYEAVAQTKNPEDVAKQQAYDEDLAEWIKNRISRELPQDLDIREDLVKLYKKLSAHQLGKEITKANTEEEPTENLSRAQFAMSGYNGPKS